MDYERRCYETRAKDQSEKLDRQSASINRLEKQTAEVQAQLDAEIARQNDQRIRDIKDVQYSVSGLLKYFRSKGEANPMNIHQALGHLRPGYRCLGYDSLFLHVLKNRSQDGAQPYSHRYGWLPTERATYFTNTQCEHVTTLQNQMHMALESMVIRDDHRLAATLCLYSGLLHYPPGYDLKADKFESSKKAQRLSLSIDHSVYHELLPRTIKKTQWDDLVKLKENQDSLKPHGLLSEIRKVVGDNQAKVLLSLKELFVDCVYGSHDGDDEPSGFCEIRAGANNTPMVVRSDTSIKSIDWVQLLQAAFLVEAESIPEKVNENNAATYARLLIANPMIVFNPVIDANAVGQDVTGFQIEINRLIEKLDLPVIARLYQSAHELLQEQIIELTKHQQLAV